MNMNFIRVTDVYLGQLTCAVLTIMRRCIGFVSPERTPAGPVRSILFIKLIEQGATVLAGDSLRRAADLVGAENVHFCVFADNRPILDVMGLVPPENVIAIRDDSLRAFITDVFRAVRKMRRLHPGAVIDLEFFSRASAALAYLSGAERRVGFHRFRGEGLYRGDLLTHRLVFNPYLHTATVYSLLMEALALDPGCIPLPKIPPPAQDRRLPGFVPDEATLANVCETLAGLGVVPGKGPIVILNPNASDIMPLRKWPQERFVELGKRLLASNDRLSLIITGSAGEQTAAARVCSAIGSPRAVSVAGQTTLREVLALYTLAKVLVTNDSGPGHFAALTDVHAVVLFGPETPARYAPVSPRSHVLWAGLACSPCINVHNHRFSPCKESRCMDAITVEEVFEAVQSCLGHEYVTEFTNKGT